jgi:hypothetical protein
MLRKAAVLTAMLATTIALAACGGSSSPTTSNASSQAKASSGLKMAECIRTHGVPKFPDPGSGPSGIQSNQGSGGGSVSVDGVQLDVSPQTLQKAMQACQKYAPQGPPVSGAQLAKIKQGALKMAQCMRAHGVPNFSDPQVTAGPNGHGIAVRIGGAAGGNAVSGGKTVGAAPSPAFQHAMSVCQPLMRVGLKAGK